jgi:hypothetical protein
MKKETANYPWVFWLSIGWRAKWFRFFWHVRGANFLEIQFWKFRISIGRPWLKSIADAHQRDYGSSQHIHKTNRDNLKQKISFLINP